MRTLDLNEALASLEQVMDDVCRSHEPTVITQQEGGHAVLISFDDYIGVLETLHLLGTEKNARRLRESIAEFRAGRISISKEVQ